MNITPWVKGAIKVAMLGAALALPGTGVAVAGTTSGNGSIGGGNQVNLPISVPVNVCGNAIAVLGLADAGCEGGASVRGGSGSGGESTSGNGSVLGGNQVNALVKVPVNVCGNSVAAIGASAAGCRGGASVRGGSGSGGESTSGNGSVLGGNQVNALVKVPVNVCGNSVAVLGAAWSQCRGGATVGTPPSQHPTPPPSQHPTPPPSQHPTPPTVPPTHVTTTHHVSTTTLSSSTSLLPTTGADLAGILTAGAAAIAAGAGSLVMVRRRRRVTSRV